jgi:MFS family permease
VIVELQTLLFVFVTIVSNFLVFYVARKGLKVTLLFGAALILLGTWLRMLVQITGKFEYITFGTIFLSAGQGFFYISSTKLSGLWFGIKERTLSTVLGALSLPIGSIFGFFLSSFFIEEKDVIDK